MYYFALDLIIRLVKKNIKYFQPCSVLKWQEKKTKKRNPFKDGPQQQQKNKQAKAALYAVLHTTKNHCCCCAKVQLHTGVCQYCSSVGQFWILFPSCIFTRHKYYFLIVSLPQPVFNYSTDDQKPAVSIV